MLLDGLNVSRWQVTLPWSLEWVPVFSSTEQSSQLPFPVSGLRLTQDPGG